MSTSTDTRNKPYDSRTLSADVRAALQERSQARRICGMAAAVSDYLSRGGTLYSINGTSSCWLEQETGRAYRTDSEALSERIAARAGVEPHAPEFTRAVRAAVAIACHCGEDTPRARIIRTTEEGDDRYTYVRGSDTDLIRVRDGQRVPNGTAGLVALPGDGMAPLGELPPPSDVPMAPVARALSDIQVRDLGEAAHWLMALLIALQMVPRHVMDARPTLALVGQSGTGKTSIGRAIATVYGSAAVAEVHDTQPRPDVQRLARRWSLLVCDHPAGNGLWIHTFLHAPGSHAALILTSRHFRIYRSYRFIESVFPIILDPPDGPLLAEGILEQRFLEQREQIWADIIELLRVAEAGRWGAGTTGEGRLSRADGIMRAMAARIQDDSSWVDRTLNRVDRARRKLVLKDDQLAELLPRGPDWGPGGRPR